MEPYSRRSLWLMFLGYEDYSHYLGGEMWKSIRKKVLTEARGSCKICGRKATQVHHQRYEMCDLDGSDLSHLVAICAGCHKLVEFKNSKTKRSFDEARAVCAALIRNGRRVNFRKDGSFKPKKPKCACGNKAKKNSDKCRTCARIALFGVAKFSPEMLPRCKGKDCKHQAAKESKYCRLHEASPETSLQEIYRRRKRIRKRIARIVR